MSRTALEAHVYLRKQGTASTSTWHAAGVWMCAQLCALPACVCSAHAGTVGFSVHAWVWSGHVASAGTCVGQALCAARMCGSGVHVAPAGHCECVSVCACVGGIQVNAYQPHLCNMPPVCKQGWGGMACSRPLGYSPSPLPGPYLCSRRPRCPQQPG